MIRSWLVGIIALVSISITANTFTIIMMFLFFPRKKPLDANLRLLPGKYQLPVAFNGKLNILSSTMSCDSHLKLYY